MKCSCEFIRLNEACCISCINLLKFLNAPDYESLEKNYIQSLKKFLSRDDIQQINKDIPRTLIDKNYKSN